MSSGRSHHIDDAHQPLSPTLHDSYSTDTNDPLHIPVHSSYLVNQEPYQECSDQKQEQTRNNHVLIADHGVAESDYRESMSGELLSSDSVTHDRNLAVKSSEDSVTVRYAGTLDDIRSDVNQQIHGESVANSSNITEIFDACSSNITPSYGSVTSCRVGGSVINRNKSLCADNRLEKLLGHGHQTRCKLLKQRSVERMQWGVKRVPWGVGRLRTEGSFRTLPLKCRQCHHVFSTRFLLNIHTRLAHRRNDSCMCVDCGKCFTYPRILTLHVKTYHDSPQSFPCHECGRMFSDRRNYRRHVMALHHHLKPHHCVLCDKTFSFKVALSRHIRALHNKEKPYTCDTCGDSFAYRSVLTRHVRALHDKIKPYVCAECNKSFSYRSVLTRHIQALHAGERPYTCSICGESFAYSNLLTRHVNSLHLTESREKIVTCTLCGKSFVNQGSLTRHTKTVHPVVYVSP